MYLFGVLHEMKYLENVVLCIDEYFPTPPTSLMAELPPSWDDLVHRGASRNFFSALVDLYRQKGTRIIYGNKNKYVAPESEDGMVGAIIEMMLSRHPGYVRDMSEGMRQTIDEERPELVAIGGGHADQIRDEFPNAYYVAFLKRSETTTYRPNRPNRVVLLEG